MALYTFNYANSLSLEAPAEREGEKESIPKTVKKSRPADITERYGCLSVIFLGS